MHKAISVYEKAATQYMAETSESNLEGMIGDENCEKLKHWFKMSSSAWLGTGQDHGCLYTTSDGALWLMNTYGNVVVHNSAKDPKYGVVMWTQDGRVNYGDTSLLFNYGVPDYTRVLPGAVPSYTGGGAGEPYVEAQIPTHGYYTAAQMINLRRAPSKEDDKKRIITPFDVLNPSPSYESQPSPSPQEEEYDLCAASGINCPSSEIPPECEASGINCPSEPGTNPWASPDPCPSPSPYTITGDSRCTQIEYSNGCRCENIGSSSAPSYSCSYVETNYDPSCSGSTCAPSPPGCAPLDSACWDDYYSIASPTPNASP